MSSLNIVKQSIHSLHSDLCGMLGQAPSAAGLLTV